MATKLRAWRLPGLTAAALLLLPPAGVAAEAFDGCARGPLADAAAALVGPGVEVADESEIGGLRTALVLDPSFIPGVRRRLIEVDDAWCAATAFNDAWDRAGRGDTVAMSAAYAQLAAAPYFDGVTVTAARQLVPGVVTLDTHALTNGVTATWVIRLDGAGVRSARWTATGFAVEPFTAQPYGLTALPGVTRTYSRHADGRLLPREPLLDLSSFEQPSLTTEVELPDGFTIEVLLSETEYGPNLGVDTGVTPVDYLRIMRDTAEDNYLEFLDWGFEGRWLTDRGTVYVNDTTASTCLACVRVVDRFNVHVSLGVREALEALGYRYPGASDYDVLSLVMGHEMIHNFQIHYAELWRPQHRWFHAFIEGTARMQEALHHYSAISHQPESLTYAQDINGCNGWNRVQQQATVDVVIDFLIGPFEEDMDAAMRDGPLTGRSYDACFFWLTFHGARGVQALVDVTDAMVDFAHLEDVNNQTFRAITQVSGESITTDLITFAAATLTGRGYEFAAADGTGEPLDWGIYLDRWEPAEIEAGERVAAVLRNGGILAREVTGAGTPTVTGHAAELFAVRAGDDGVAILPLMSGELLEEPAAGERLWLVAVHPEVTASEVTIGF